MKFLPKWNWSALESASNHVWFFPFISLLAAADLFILVVPTDGVSVSATLLQPKRWIRIAISIAIGSTLGALLLTWLVKNHGPWIVSTFFENALQSSTWLRAQEFISDWGLHAICAIAMSFLPLQPAVVLAGLSPLPMEKIVTWIFVGRLAKFVGLGWLTSHAPRFLARFKTIRTELGEVKNQGNQ